MRLGSAYVGSPNKLTSTANQEIVQQHKPSGWTMAMKFYKFSFMNYQDCHVRINGSDPIFLAANQGFEMNEVDALIKTFEIIDSGIEYSYIGAY